MACLHLSFVKALDCFAHDASKVATGRVSTTGKKGQFQTTMIMPQATLFSRRLYNPTNPRADDGFQVQIDLIQVFDGKYPGIEQKDIPYPIDNETTFFIPSRAITCLIHCGVDAAGVNITRPITAVGKLDLDTDQIRIDSMDDDTTWFWFQITAIPREPHSHPSGSQTPVVFVCGAEEMAEMVATGTGGGE
jgi:hypothetical protein